MLVNLCRERITMLTGLKVLSLAFECVFYKPEHNSKGWLYEIESWTSWNVKMKYRWEN